MNILFFILLGLVLLVVLGAGLISFTMSLLWTLLMGLIIGALARVLVRGSGSMGLLATSLCGVGGSLLGNVLAKQLFNTGSMVAFIVSILCAAVLCAFYIGTEK